MHACAHTHTIGHTHTLASHAHPIYGTHTVRNQIPFKHTCGKAEGLSLQRLVTIQTPLSFSFTLSLSHTHTHTHTHTHSCVTQGFAKLLYDNPVTSLTLIVLSV